MQLLIAIGAFALAHSVSPVREEARLNEAYQELLTEWRTNPPRRQALRVEERKWVAERDRKCGKGGASAQACRARAAAQRADELEAQAHL